MGCKELSIERQMTIPSVRLSDRPAPQAAITRASKERKTFPRTAAGPLRPGCAAHRSRNDVWKTARAYTFFFRKGVNQASSRRLTIAQQVRDFPRDRRHGSHLGEADESHQHRPSSAPATGKRAILLGRRIYASKKTPNPAKTPLATLGPGKANPQFTLPGSLAPEPAHALDLLGRPA